MFSCEQLQKPTKQGYINSKHGVTGKTKIAKLVSTRTSRDVNSVQNPSTTRKDCHLNCPLKILARISVRVNHNF